MSNIIQRLYGSTLGLPHQLLMRMLRMMKEGDINILDKEGFADPGLIPLLGIFADHEKDAFGSDLVDSTAGGFALDIALDPVTYMSGGLSAAGKGGKAMSLASRASASKNMLKQGRKIRELGNGHTVDEFVKIAKEELATGKLTPEGTKKIQDAIAQLQPYLSKTSDELLEASRKEVLMWAVPGLRRLGMEKAVNTTETSWFKLIGSETRRITGVATSPLRGLVAGHPVLEKLAQSVTIPIKALSSGLKTPATPGLKMEFGKMEKEGFTALDAAVAKDVESMRGPGRSLLREKLVQLEEKGKKVDEEFDKIFDHLTDAGKGTVEENAQRAFLRSLGYDAPKNPEALNTAYVEIRRHLTELPGSARDFTPFGGGEVREAVDNFNKNWNKSTDILKNNEVQIVPTEGALKEIEAKVDASGSKLAKGLFTVGKSMRAVWHKVFKSDIPIEGAEEVGKLFNNAVFSSSEAAQEWERTLGQLLRAESEKTGRSVGALRSLLNNALEGSTGIEERNLLREIGGDPEQLDRASGLFAKHISKTHTSILQIGNILSSWGIRGAEDLTKLIGKNEAAILHTDASIAKTFSIVDPDNSPLTVFGGSSDFNYNRGRIKNVETGEFRDGEYFGFMDDAALQKEADKIKRSVERKLTPDEVLSGERVFQEALTDFKVPNDKTHLFINALERAHKGTLKKFLGKPLTEEQIKRFEALADGYKRNLDVGRLPHLGELSLPEYSRMRDAEKLLKLRKEGKETQFFKSQPEKVLHPDDVGPRKDLLTAYIKDAKGRWKSESALGRAFIQLVAANTEVKRILKAHKLEIKNAGDAQGKAAARINAVAGDDFAEASELLAKAADTIDNELERIIRNGLGKEGNALFDGLLKLRQKTTKQAVELGMDWTPGFLPRLLSSGGSKALRELGSAMTHDTMQKLAPQMSSSMPRDLGHLTLAEVNSLMDRALEIGQPKLHKALKDILKSEDLILEARESDPILSFVNHLGSLSGRRATANLVDDLTKLGDEIDVLGGEAIGWAHGDRYFLTSDVTTSTAKAQFKDKKVTVVGEDLVSHEYYKTHILIKTTKGDVVPIPTDAIGGTGYSFLNMGPTMTRQAVSKEGKVIEQPLSSGQHYARRTMDMAMNAQEFGKIKPGQDPDWINDLIGNQILFGNDAVLGSIHNTVSKNFHVAGPVLRQFDVVNSFLRRWQTVFRPSFQFSNLVSGMFQGGMLGTSTRNTVGGHINALKFLYNNTDEFAQSADELSAILGKHQIVGGKGIAAGPTGMVRVLRRIGAEGKTVSDAELKALGLEHIIGKTFELGDGQIYTGREILEASAKGGLFGTFFARGFAGGASTPEGAAKLLQETVGKKGFTGGIAEEAGAELGILKRLEHSGALEMSEIISRFGTLFGRLRTHGDLPRAVKESQRAMVNYAELTSIERDWIKRASLYYTFPRKFIPFALERFGKSPRYLSNIVHGIQDLGAFSTEGGKVSLNLDMPGLNSIELDAQRLNAAVDAAMFIPAVYERLVPTQTLNAPFNPPGGIGFGGVASIAFGREPFDPGSYQPERHWMEDAFYSTYATKFLLNGAKDISSALGLIDEPGEIDYLDELARTIVPVKFVEDGYHQKRVLRNYTRLRGMLEREIQEESLVWRRSALIRQLESLTEQLSPAIKAEQ